MKCIVHAHHAVSYDTTSPIIITCRAPSSGWRVDVAAGWLPAAIFPMALPSATSSSLHQRHIAYIRPPSHVFEAAVSPALPKHAEPRNANVYGSEVQPRMHCVHLFRSQSHLGRVHHKWLRGSMRIASRQHESCPSSSRLTSRFAISYQACGGRLEHRGCGSGTGTLLRHSTSLP